MPVTARPVVKPIMGEINSHFERSRAYVAVKSSWTRGKYLRRSGFSSTRSRILVFGLNTVVSAIKSLSSAFLRLRNSCRFCLCSQNFSSASIKQGACECNSRNELARAGPKFSTTRCDLQTHAPSIRGIGGSLQQTFLFATVHQFHDRIVFQPQQLRRIRNRRANSSGTPATVSSS